jgi:hypothetical protein
MSQKIRVEEWSKVPLRPGVDLQTLRDKMGGEDFALARHPRREKHVAFIGKLKTPYRVPKEKVSVTSVLTDRDFNGMHFEFEVHVTYPFEGEMAEMWPDAFQDYLSDLPQIENEVRDRAVEIETITSEEEYILVQGSKVTLIWVFVGLYPASAIRRDRRYDR